MTAGRATAPRRCTCSPTSRRCRSPRCALLQIAAARRRGADPAAGWSARVVLHDLLLLPVYTALDRARAPRAAGRGRSTTCACPLGVSALLLLVFFPVIAGKGEARLRAA